MGHGHVIPNADGSRVRCGGPPICEECALEQARVDLNLDKDKEPEILIHSMKVEKGQVNMELSTNKKVMLHIADSLAGCLREHSAPNFVVMDVHHPEEGWLSLTIQKRYGLSPTEKIIKMTDLLKEVLNSDMAQREEDEGNVSPLLTKIREFLK